MTFSSNMSSNDPYATQISSSTDTTTAPTMELSTNTGLGDLTLSSLSFGLPSFGLDILAPNTNTSVNTIANTQPLQSYTQSNHTTMMEMEQPNSHYNDPHQNYGGGYYSDDNDDDILLANFEYPGDDNHPSGPQDAQIFQTTSTNPNSASTTQSSATQYDDYYHHSSLVSSIDGNKSGNLVVMNSLTLSLAVANAPKFQSISNHAAADIVQGSSVANSSFTSMGTSGGYFGGQGVPHDNLHGVPNASASYSAIHSGLRQASLAGSTGTGKPKPMKASPFSSTSSTESSMMSLLRKKKTTSSAQTSVQASSCSSSQSLSKIESSHRSLGGFNSFTLPSSSSAGLGENTGGTFNVPDSLAYQASSSMVLRPHGYRSSMKLEEVHETSLPESEPVSLASSVFSSPSSSFSLPKKTSDLEMTMDECLRSFPAMNLADFMFCDRLESKILSDPLKPIFSEIVAASISNGLIPDIFLDPEDDGQNESEGGRSFDGIDDSGRCSPGGGPSLALSPANSYIAYQRSRSQASSPRFDPSSPIAQLTAPEMGINMIAANVTGWNDAECLRASTSSAYSWTHKNVPDPEPEKETSNINTAVSTIISVKSNNKNSNNSEVATSKMSLAERWDHAFSLTSTSTVNAFQEVVDNALVSDNLLTQITKRQKQTRQDTVEPEVVSSPVLNSVSNSRSGIVVQGTVFKPFLQLESTGLLDFSCLYKQPPILGDQASNGSTISTDVSPLPSSLSLSSSASASASASASTPSNTPSPISSKTESFSISSNPNPSYCIRTERSLNSLLYLKHRVDILREFQKQQESLAIQDARKDSQQHQDHNFPDQDLEQDPDQDPDQNPREMKCEQSSLQKLQSVELSRPIASSASVRSQSFLSTATSSFSFLSNEGSLLTTGRGRTPFKAQKPVISSSKSFRTKDMQRQHPPFVRPTKLKKTTIDPEQVHHNSGSIEYQATCSSLEKPCPKILSLENANGVRLSSTSLEPSSIVTFYHPETGSGGMSPEYLAQTQALTQTHFQSELDDDNESESGSMEELSFLPLHDMYDYNEYGEIVPHPFTRACISHISAGSSYEEFLIAKEKEAKRKELPEHFLALQRNAQIQSIG